MEKLAAVGGGAFVLTCLVLGVRLVALWFRTREVPELCIGLGLFLMGGVGYPLMMTARMGTSLPDETRGAIVVVCILCSLIGNVCVCVFNWRVFRPESPVAASLTVAVGLALLGLFAAQGFGPGFAAFARSAGGAWDHAAPFGAFAYAWAGLESLAYYLRMRRRQALGLADPVVTDRLRLWAVGTLSAVVISVTGLAFRALGIEFRTSAVGGIMIGTLGMLTATAMWLAFLPPTRYLARVRGSNPA